MNIQISYSPRQHLDMQQVMSGAHKHHHQSLWDFLDSLQYVYKCAVYSWLSHLVILYTTRVT